MAKLVWWRHKMFGLPAQACRKAFFQELSYSRLPFHLQSLEDGAKAHCVGSCDNSLLSCEKEGDLDNRWLLKQLVKPVIHLSIVIQSEATARGCPGDDAQWHVVSWGLSATCQVVEWALVTLWNHAQLQPHANGPTNACYLILSLLFIPSKTDPHSLHDMLSFNKHALSIRDTHHSVLEPTGTKKEMQLIWTHPILKRGTFSDSRIMHKRYQCDWFNRKEHKT